MPEANSMMVLGSGVVPLVEPLKVNVSEGIVPSVFSLPTDGHPGEGQPTPLFSSQ
jgi:hypothetical protein